MLRRPGTAAAVALAVALGVSSCGSTRYPHLVIPGHLNAVSMGVDVRPGSPELIGGMIVCLDRPGRVHVTSVQPIKPTGGFTVARWVLRRSPWWTGSGGVIGSERTTLAAAGYRGGSVVDLACQAKTGRGYELAVQVTRPATERARTVGFRLSYLAQGHTGTLDFPYTITLRS